MPNSAPMRIAMLGGIPASLGGGGLELQMRRTAAGLRKIGYEVVHAGAACEPRPFDVLHAFAADPGVCHALEHWRRNTGAPFVLSPVVVVAPGAREWTLRVSHRLPLPAYAPYERALALRRADAVIALTEYERGLIRALAGRRVRRIEVIGNGVDPAGDPVAGELRALALPDDYVLLLGTVSARKRQREIVRALGRSGQAVVIAGGIGGGDRERLAFESEVAAVGARWLGEIDDAALVAALLRGARALVHFSSAEGQSLAVLEALSVGCPVITTALPGHHELAEAHPELVRLVAGIEDVVAALRGLGTAVRKPAAIPTWTDVATRLAAVYRELTASR